MFDFVASGQQNEFVETERLTKSGGELSVDLELWSYTFRETPIVDLAAVAGKAGFRSITATPAQIAATGLAPAELRSRIEAEGVVMSAIDGLCSALPGTPLYRKPGEPTLEECLATAKALGVPTVNLVHIGGEPTPIAALAEAFATACARAAEEGVNLAIEFVPGTGIPDMRTCLEVVRAADAANGGVCLDTWHYSRSGGTLEELTPEVMHWVLAFQVADRSPEQDLQPYVPMRGRKLPGDGALPLAEIVRRLRAVRPEVPLGAEILSDQMDALGPQAGALRLAEACRGLLGGD